VKEEELKRTLLNAHQEYAVVFVYMGDCVYCSRQLPILLALKKKWNIPILGVSVDGAYYEGFDDNITDTDVAQDPSIQAFPTILLLNKRLPKKIFISKGLTTLDQLEEKIFHRITQD
jgi:conjugal transfer pilus assembly protein TraF